LGITVGGGSPNPCIQVQRFRGGLVFKAHRHGFGDYGWGRLASFGDLGESAYAEIVANELPVVDPLQGESSLLTTYWSESTLSS